MKKKIEISKKNLVLLISFIVLISVGIVSITYAKYEIHAKSVAPLEYALYIINLEPVSDTVKLSEIKPSNDEYVYAFSVSNFKDKKRLEVNLEYSLVIRSTTNLPLEYRLVVNDDYKTNTSNAFVSDEVVADSDGTYFRIMKAPDSNFSYRDDETNYYYLIVKFPLNYVDSKYQDITEFLSIEINSKQVI